MVSLEKAVVAHLESGGFRFEVLVDPEAAQKIKEGKALEVLEDQARPAGRVRALAGGRCSPRASYCPWPGRARNLTDHILFLDGVT